ncbi:cytochrome c oxidase accessory protein CcoG [Accumulibacter sp.]|uniref:cytochrome c oxidase accessory protein CcoG n=1 Tax=Accumulibacter sp. TaxID=2053492 RepID=UPI0025D2A2CC|nr:cytochrome c oxidase accessory protein CcoG [Accumulibacter sp.]MCM8596630.1 cytochrome c oxidase accessory protein CcoG [Accumulibacter sp.]MCM8627549.1 cytochrome c oxidase accessory protein CcoG [Accumulibacter sp.]MDS4050778.1 cytochrome c oxidase accessory protein CcoG [Accumulibacter sp.]
MDQLAGSRPSAVPVKVDSLYEKHRTVYARSVTGTFNNWRWAMVFLTQALFYGLCWLDWGDRQAVLFHLVERKFYIFGLIFWPQDVIYLAVLLVISAYSLFLVTALGGRLFCGYACPQTVYTEILMWIERKIEGDRPARMKLDAQPMNARKLRLKVTKHALWLTIALWTGITFVGYFTPIRELLGEIVSFSLGPWETFWIFFYAAFLYMMAGFLREQVCKYMCPYARFQGVMFDPDTLIIGYDPERGEPRGARRKKTAAGQALGDCVDCSICVQVCPTGIDIRNGLQLECIACAACIDACDQVMDKVGLPRGLIRYSTENALARRYTRRETFAQLLRPRTLLYTSILLAIIAATAWSLGQRVPLKVDVLRDRSTLSREADDGRIENVYRLHVSNTDDRAHRYLIGVSGLAGIEIAGPTVVEVPAASSRTVALAARVEPEAGTRGSHPVFFELRADDQEKIAVREKTSFFLP